MDCRFAPGNAMQISDLYQQIPAKRERGVGNSHRNIINPKCGDAYLQLGILSSSQHDFEMAIGFYIKAIDVDPQLGEAHYRLGVAYDRIGLPEKAKQEFQLHDEIEKQQAAAVERQRREVKQFLVVLQGQAATPPAQ